MTKMPMTNYRIAFGHYFEAINMFKELFNEHKENKYLEAIAKLKRKYRKDMQNYYKEPEFDMIIYNKDGYGWKKLFRIEFDGDKSELLEYLWNEVAISTGSAFDCTGRPFTAAFDVAHIKDNIYKVCEYISLDV